MQIDTGILRQQIRQRLETDELLTLLDRAVELIPQNKLPEFITGFFDPDSLQVDEQAIQISLLDEVQGFYKESLAGAYYEGFRVNSRNFMNQSRGTVNWIAEFHRFMDSCIDACKSSNHLEAQQSFELLFNLLAEVDECRDDIIFFADEGGSWQVGVNWQVVLPSYFEALATVTKPKAYAQAVLKVVGTHVNYERNIHLQTASDMAKPSQRKSLKAVCSN